MKDIIPNNDSSSFAEMERQFEKMHIEKQSQTENSAAEEKRETPFKKEDELITLDSEWNVNPEIEPIPSIMPLESAEETSGRNDYNKRVKKYIYENNQLKEKTNVLEQDNAAILSELQLKERLIEEQRELLINARKLELESDRKYAEALFDRSLEEGDSKNRREADKALRAIDKELMKVETVLDDIEYSRRNNQHIQPNNQRYQPHQYQQPASPTIAPENVVHVQSFFERNPDILNNERMYLRVKNIDDQLADECHKRGLSHMVGSQQYVNTLERAFKGQFNRPSSGGQTAGSHSASLTENQKMMATHLFGKDVETGKKRTAAEAQEMYKKTIMNG